MEVHQRTRAQNTHVRVGLEVVGVLALTALPSIDEERWVPMVQETDVLLVNGGDPLCLCYWMRQSGLADILPSLRAVYVGLSAGSIVMTPNIGEDFVRWKPPTGGDRTLGGGRLFDVSAPGSRGPAGEHHGRRRKVGRRHAGARRTRLTIRPLSK
jgi:Peptidase family S51